MQNQTLFAQPFDSSSVSPVSSYALGPLAFDDLTTLTLTLENGYEGGLLVPGSDLLPVAILADPAFRDGAYYGFSSGECDDLLEGTLTIPQLVNWVYRSFLGDIGLELAGNNYRDSLYPFYIGYVLGVLSALAVSNLLFALAGIAHLFYLASLVPWLPADPSFARYLYHADLCHNEAVGAYRSRWQEHKERGFPSDLAQRYALAAEPAYLDTLVPSPACSILSCPCRKSRCEYPDCAMGEPESSDTCLIVECEEVA